MALHLLYAVAEAEWDTAIEPTPGASSEQSPVAAAVSSSPHGEEIQPVDPGPILNRKDSLKAMKEIHRKANELRRLLVPKRRQQST